MPIYVYQCPRCIKICEVIQKLNDPPPICSDCENLDDQCEMERIFDSTGSTFVLKGNCWAKDGYSK